MTMKPIRLEIAQGLVQRGEVVLLTVSRHLGLRKPGGGCLLWTVKSLLFYVFFNRPRCEAACTWPLGQVPGAVTPYPLLMVDYDRCGEQTCKIHENIIYFYHSSYGKQRLSGSLSFPLDYIGLIRRNRKKDRI